MTRIGTRIIPAEDLGYEATKGAMERSIGQPKPVRIGQRIAEGLTATALAVDEQDGWLVVTFEINDERTRK